MESSEYVDRTLRIVEQLHAEFGGHVRAVIQAYLYRSGDDIADHIPFRVPPGKYRIEVYLTDLNAERTSSTTIPLEVPGVAAGQLWLTDLYLFTDPTRNNYVVLMTDGQPNCGNDPQKGRDSNGKLT